MNDVIGTIVEIECGIHIRWYDIINFLNLKIVLWLCESAVVLKKNMLIRNERS